MRQWLSSLLVVLALVFVAHRVHAQPSLKLLIVPLIVRLVRRS